MVIKIIPNDKASPVGKLAEVELHFSEGPLEGLKLIGFGVWERRSTGAGKLTRNVTFPAQQYAVNGERRTFAQLRPITGHGVELRGVAPTERLRDLILDAYTQFEIERATA